jgi:hypothetical protein
MIIYNVTVIIDDTVREEWLNWMKTKHIPEVLETGCFMEHRMSKILSGEQDGGTSYSIQYLCESHSKYDEYQEKFAPALQDDHTQKYAGKFGAFRTIMEVVDHSNS